MEKELESRYKIYKLRDALNKLEGEYDRVYIDTPPSFNFYSKSALIAADSVLIPFDCDSFARQSLYSLLDNIGELQEDHNPELSVEGIIINQFNAQARLPGRAGRGTGAGGPAGVPDLPVTSSVKMKESHRDRRPLIDLAPGHKLTQQLLDAARGARAHRGPRRRLIQPARQAGLMPPRGKWAYPYTLWLFVSPFLIL